MEQDIIKIIEEVKKIFVRKEISIISQNCIGGVIYKDIEMKFLSPTINLYFESKSFIKFINNLEYYIDCELKMIENSEIVTGMLDDVKIIFLHYRTAEEAKEKWEQRKDRIMKEKVFVISTDRDGFDDEDFENFKKINYPKALITRNESWQDYDFVIYLKEYKDLKEIPNTIPKREFYKNNKIIKLLNEM